MSEHSHIGGEGVASTLSVCSDQQIVLFIL